MSKARNVDDTFVYKDQYGRVVVINLPSADVDISPNILLRMTAPGGITYQQIPFELDQNLTDKTRAHLITERDRINAQDQGR